MVATNGGVDRICVKDRKEASGMLIRLLNETSLSKKEICDSVSFDLSVSEIVRAYNDFVRFDEGRVIHYGTGTVKRAA